MTVNISGYEIEVFFKAPKTDAQRAFIGRIVDRARTLFTDGYVWCTNHRGDYFVTRPSTDEEFLAGKTTTYKVTEQTCECEAKALYNDCKHRIAVAVLITEENARNEMLCEEYERTLGSGETAEGCDADYYLD